MLKEDIQTQVNHHSKYSHLKMVAMHFHLPNVQGNNLVHWEGENAMQECIYGKRSKDNYVQQINKVHQGCWQE